MFTSPSPIDIILQLRFGFFSDICDTHIDRFGRRSYYFKREDEDYINFATDLKLNMFSDVDKIELSDFVIDIDSEYDGSTHDLSDMCTPSLTTPTNADVEQPVSTLTTHMSTIVSNKAANTTAGGIHITPIKMSRSKDNSRDNSQKNLRLKPYTSAGKSIFRAGCSPKLSPVPYARNRRRNRDGSGLHLF